MDEDMNLGELLKDIAEENQTRKKLALNDKFLSLLFHFAPELADTFFLNGIYKMRSDF